MFESKMTTRSGWGQMTSMNSSCAPGFVPIPCPSHQQYSITNICKASNCIQPLCPECIAGHVQLHQQSKKPAKIQNIITTRTTCIEQLAVMKYEVQKQIEQSISKSTGNIQSFVEAHQKRLDTAYKKIIKIVDDIFDEMNKQMQVIANAYMSEKQKRQKQAKMKLSPLNDYYTRVSEYKEQLQSNDYIPALIQILNEPPRKPKYEPISEIQNYGSVQINQKYLDDIKSDISKFVKVIVNCKDEAFKGRVQMNKSNFNGSNNMKFSRFDRSRSKDAREDSQSRIGQSRRSNSKKKIFGCQSIISDIKPAVNSDSRIQMNNNSIYNKIKEKDSQTYARQSSGKNLQQVQCTEIRYLSYSTPIKITKSSYFTNNNCSLWYFKDGTKNGFRAYLQSIEAGFQKVQLNINVTIPENHRTIITPNGSVFVIGGDSTKEEGTLNKVYRLSDHDLSFKEVSAMLHPRSSFGVCYFQECIYVAGGQYCENSKWATKKPTRQFQKYSIRQNKWSRLSPLPDASYDFSMHGLSSGKIIKLGGMSQSRVFIHKIDIYQISNNSWTQMQLDSRFQLTISPGLTQIGLDSLVIFGGRIPTGNQKCSKCYILNESAQNNGLLMISQGPELYNQASFENAYVHDGAIISIQNNQINNRNKLIMGYKYDQWKFISC